MKKIAAVIVFILILGLLIPVAQAVGTDAIEINSPDGLMKIAGNPDGKYILTADIDMKGVDWSPVALTGEFDGGGHTIYNLKITRLGEDHATTVDGNHKKYDTYFAALFSVVKGAVIKNVNLLNVDVRITTDKNCFAAGLAGFAEDTAISGCSVQGRVYLYQTNWMCGVAGVVGFGYGTITDCSADVELVYVDEDTKIKCEEFLGGILACGYSDIDGCTVKLKGYASVQGYVHNGGVVGMHHIHYSKDNNHKGYVKNCSVDAAIYFYENNRDRRAYCKAVIGEKLNGNVKLSNNTTVFFKNGETKNYKTVLLPETCENPEYTATVTPPTCTERGFTTYTCKQCGYTYTGDVTAPAHTSGEWVTVKEPTTTEAGLKQLACSVCGKVLEEQEIPMHVAGDWVVSKEPTVEQPGLKQRFCKDCGKLLEEEVIPKLEVVYASSCNPDKTELNLNYKDSAVLKAELLPANATNTAYSWAASDANVATVDAQGNVTAVGCGTAVITCASADGHASGTCNVTVSYTFWQWIIVYILFGWIWY